MPKNVVLRLYLSTTWMSNTIDWEYSSNLSLMSISSYVEYETGNIYCVLMVYCGLNNNTFKLFSREHIVGLKDC